MCYPARPAAWQVGLRLVYVCPVIRFRSSAGQPHLAVPGRSLPGDDGSACSEHGQTAKQLAMPSVAAFGRTNLHVCIHGACFGRRQRPHPRTSRPAGPAAAVAGLRRRATSPQAVMIRHRSQDKCWNAFEDHANRPDRRRRITISSTSKEVSIFTLESNTHTF